MASTFPYEKDMFNGAKVDLCSSCPPAEQFDEALRVSLAQWKDDGIRGVWLKIGVAHSHSVALADKHGFRVHHAQDGYIMMTKWLPADEPNLLPGYASHYVGAAGLVVNDENQLLVIKEKFQKNPRWKLPGGLMDPGENIGDAVMREVVEETGVRTEFVSLVSIRHTLSYQFKRGDLYIACHMRPLTLDIHRCEHEIEECRWMDISEFLALVRSGEVYELNGFIVESFLEQQRHGVALEPSRVMDRVCYTPRLKQPRDAAVLNSGSAGGAIGNSVL